MAARVLQVQVQLHADVAVEQRARLHQDRLARAARSRTNVSPGACSSNRPGPCSAHEHVLVAAQRVVRLALVARPGLEPDLGLLPRVAQRCRSRPGTGARGSRSAGRAAAARRSRRRRGCPTRRRGPGPHASSMTSGSPARPGSSRRPGWN